MSFKCYFSSLFLMDECIFAKDFGIMGVYFYQFDFKYQE